MLGSQDLRIWNGWVGERGSGGIFESAFVSLLGYIYIYACVCMYVCT